MDSVPVVTRNLILTNIAVFLVTMLREDFMFETFSLFCPGSSWFRWWQPLTHMFMHGGWWHIFFNMYALFLFGSVLERQWGAKKFLIFYFVTGLGAAALHTGVQLWQASVLTEQVAQGVSGAATALGRLYNTPTVGASGAIYGLLLGYAMLFPDSILRLVFPPIALKAKWFVLIFAAIELITGYSNFNDGVAHFAHLGGMLFGWLLILWWKKKRTLYDYYD